VYFGEAALIDKLLEISPSFCLDAKGPKNQDLRKITQKLRDHFLSRKQARE
jgi:hypothetical protein